jgi:hypothetical protein
MGTLTTAWRSPAALLALAALLVAGAALASSLGGSAGAVSLAKVGEVKERSKQGTVPGNSFENVQARCRKGYESISGGVSMDPSNPGPVYESVKNGRRGWNVGVRNPGIGAVNFTAIVYCAKR